MGTLNGGKTSVREDCTFFQELMGYTTEFNLCQSQNRES